MTQVVPLAHVDALVPVPLVQVTGAGFDGGVGWQVPEQDGGMALVHTSRTQLVPAAQMGSAVRVHFTGAGFGGGEA